MWKWREGFSLSHLASERGAPRFFLDIKRAKDILAPSKAGQITTRTTHSAHTTSTFDIDSLLTHIIIIPHTSTSPL
jgi:hypothetical protein